jgi:hypothetical protein
MDHKACKLKAFQFFFFKWRVIQWLQYIIVPGHLKFFLKTKHMAVASLVIAGRLNSTPCGDARLVLSGPLGLS